MLDIDSTDNPLHGQQEGRFFHGYYDSYCYLPLYVFCAQQLLCAYLHELPCDALQPAGGSSQPSSPILARPTIPSPGKSINGSGRWCC